MNESFDFDLICQWAVNIELEFRTELAFSIKLFRFGDILDCSGLRQPMLDQCVECIEAPPQVVLVVSALVVSVAEMLKWCGRLRQWLRGFRYCVSPESSEADVTWGAIHRYHWQTVSAKDRYRTTRRLKYLKSIIGCNQCSKSSKLEGLNGFWCLLTWNTRKNLIKRVFCSIRRMFIFREICFNCESNIDFEFHYKFLRTLNLRQTFGKYWS